MKSILIASLILSASIAGVAEAASVDLRYMAPDIHIEIVPQPARTITRPNGRQYQFFGWADRVTYTTGLPDRKIHGFWGFHGLEFRGLPSWLREVKTSAGRDLVGSPQPGTFTIQMYRDGKHIPTLDNVMTFIPR
ncbi:hypothetical protein [Peteryoungia algae]|uniref:Uncharacterized protein n=1 Tax=Peteryoungia algae TaxID=2919917 RepID=A0ABT0CW61_9HYPH|nr:hypothetical protein [Rhizobium sp. SSM4.3]MCJ8237405.1 hypothetical protein [Rhizobium sp. SSM4.3]